MNILKITFILYIFQLFFKNSNSTTINFSKNCLIIEEILQNVKNINLYLWNSTDYDNPYINYFIKQFKCPLFLNMNYKVQNIQKFSLENKKHENFIITVKNCKDFENKFKFFIHRTGIYFFIILEIFSCQYENKLRIAWQNIGNLNVYILKTKTEEIFSYDPFYWNSSKKIYGKIIETNQRKNLLELFIDLNGYPLRIENFRSVFSVPIYKNGSNFTDIVEFKRIDGILTNLLQKRMNFTLIRQIPDSNLFGYVSYFIVYGKFFS